MNTAHSLASICSPICAMGLALTAGTALAGTTAFEATITSDQEPTDTGSPATGTLIGEYDSVANTFSFSYEITGSLLGTPSAPGAHIHNAPAGSNGGIVFAFATGAWNLSDSFVWTGLSTAQVDELFAGNMYANFHTDQFPGGEIRGQIGVVPAPAAVGLLGLAGLAAARRRR